jgi:tRNA-dihydrouridine synthase C
MEGLLDFSLRDVLTRVGGIDLCVSEFIRVTGTLLPERTFLRIVPELAHGGCTPAGTPVRAQLMGSDAVCLAENAARLAGLGPAGIDLNFGCPAKVVNRHGGGAALLDDPELVYRIVHAVRRAVPAHMPVSAKMRLGFRDDSQAEACAQAIEAAGASQLVIHARTRDQGYQPPAYWHRIGDIRQVVHLPLVANGEIWTLNDAKRCQAESGCDDVMLGRGMVSDPGLALHILGQASSTDWNTLLPLLGYFWQQICQHIEPKARAGRMKQWLNYLRRRYPEAETAYQTLRTVHDRRLIDAWLQAHVPTLQPRQQPRQDK